MNKEKLKSMIIRTTGMTLAGVVAGSIGLAGLYISSTKVEDGLYSHNSELILKDYDKNHDGHLDSKELSDYLKENNSNTQPYSPKPKGDPFPNVSIFPVD